MLTAETERDRATILLAEDDEHDAFFVDRALKKAGLDHRLVRVTNGEECINYLTGEGEYGNRAKYPFPNLVLLDLKMPVISGLEVLSWLENHPQYKGVPIVVLSGSVLPRDRQDSLNRGALDYRTKPAEFNELVEVVQELNTRCLAVRAT
jgi:CheY-like chemotaxis protein